MQQEVVKRHIILDTSYSPLNIEHHHYTFYLASIVSCIQRFSLAEQFEEHIVYEIATVTQNYIHLHFHRQSASTPVMMPYVAGRLGFLVHWKNEVYGSLQVRYDEKVSEQNILSFALCERFARDCAWGIYGVEIEREQHHQKQKEYGDARQKVLSLSPAQHKVLELIVQGLSTSEIAEALQLSKRTVETHQLHIYALLNVHSQRETMLIGLAAGMLGS